MTHQTRFLEADFDGPRCKTGRDGGSTCREYREMYSRSLFGSEKIISACHHYNWELERVEGPTMVVVRRCLGCVRDFGNEDHDGRLERVPDPVLERFDVPVQTVSRSVISQSHVSPPTNGLRAVDRPTSMLRVPQVRKASPSEE